MSVLKVLGGYLEVEGGGAGGGQPPGIWPSPGHPAHPIAPGGQPPGIWGPTDPRPGYGLPGGGGQPPGIWGPTDPRPGYGLPGGGQGGGKPPGTWGGSGEPFPGYGPVPPQPTEPPPDGADKPPPEDAGGWGYVAEWAKWGYFPAEGEAGPKG